MPNSKLADAGRRRFTHGLAALCRRPARANPGGGRNINGDVWMCSIPPVLFLIVFAWHRDGAIVTEIAPSRRSQPSVLTGKRLHRWFVKSRAQSSRRAPVRPPDAKRLRPPERLRGRSRMPQSREGETQAPRASSRKRAVLRSHSETRTEELTALIHVWRRKGGIAALVPGGDRPGLLGAAGASEQRGAGEGFGGPAQEAFSGGLGFRHMGCDRVHQRRRQAVIRLEPDLLQPRTDAGHLLRLHARFDDRGDEGGELRRLRALLLE